MFKKYLKEDKYFLLILFFINIIVGAILWIAYPLHSGPDGQNYIYYFLDAISKEPLFPWFISYITPLSPFFYGGLINAGGIILTSLVSGFLSLSSVFIFYLIGRNWSKNIARASSLVLTFYLPFHIQFHQIGSDALFSWGLLVFFLVYYFALEKKDVKSWFFLGLITAFNMLIRPSAFGFLFVIVSIFFFKSGWKKILKLLVVFSLSVIILFGSFICYKGVRYGDFSISRGSNLLGFSRIYTLQKPLLSKENGPYSDKLISMIEENILNTELYQLYDISIDDFLSHRINRRFYADIVVMVDRIEGWDTEYELLKKVAQESIKNNLTSFTFNYLKDTANLITLIQPIPPSPTPISSREVLFSVIDKDPTEKITPTEGELIPYSNIWWGLTRPDGSIPEISEFEKFYIRFDKIYGNILSQEGNAAIVNIIQKIWDYLKISFLFFWVLGLFGIAISKGIKRNFIIIIFAISLSIIIGTLYGNPVYPRYRLPMDSMIIFSAIIGISSLARLKRENKKN